jgi:glycosyltransferase involved in cell wall biosynthesis
MKFNFISNTRKIKRKRAFFYSSVTDRNLFKITGFYTTDIKILEDLGYKVIATNSVFDFLMFWKYDITFIYFWTKGVMPAILSKIFFKKVLFTGGIDWLDQNYNKSKINFFFRKIFFKLCALISDANIIVSKSDINNIRKFSPEISKIYHLPHVIDFDRYVYNHEEKENLITTVVWMEAKENVIRKGVDTLLYTFSESLKLNKNLKLEIIGSIGEGTKHLLDIAKSLNITDKISFTGRITENEKIMRLKKSKFYFQISLYEGFGIAAIEALAAGNIVIHSGRGGLSEAIGRHGILIENISDYADIARKLDDILCHYDEYSEFISQGIKHVEDSFSYHVRRDGIDYLLKSL